MDGHTSTGNAFRKFKTKLLSVLVPLEFLKGLNVNFLDLRTSLLELKKLFE